MCRSNLTVPLVLFGIGTVGILVIELFGLLFDKPYIEICAGAFGMTFTLGILADGSLCTAIAYSSGFVCQSTAIGIYALIPTFFTMICFVHVIVGYRTYSKTPITRRN